MTWKSISLINPDVMYGTFLARFLASTGIKVHRQCWRWQNKLLGEKFQAHLSQRRANSVFWTEYEYEYYSVWEIWANTNTNTIRVQKCRQACSSHCNLDLWDECRNPLRAGAEKVEVKLSHMLCTKLGGDELSALPHTFILMWSHFCSLKFITKCLKTRSKLEALSFTASNVWEHGFVLIFNCISHQISLISAARSLLQLPQISGDMYFSLSLLFHICFNFVLHICAFVICCRHWPAYFVEWKGNVVALPSILHPFSEGCSNRLFF